MQQFPLELGGEAEELDFEMPAHIQQPLIEKIVADLMEPLCKAIIRSFLSNLLVSVAEAEGEMVILERIIFESP